MNLKKITDSAVSAVFARQAAKQTNPNFKDVKFAEVPPLDELDCDYAFTLTYGDQTVRAERDMDLESELWYLTDTYGNHKNVRSDSNAVRYAIKYINEVVPVSQGRFNNLK